MPKNNAEKESASGGNASLPKPYYILQFLLGLKNNLDLRSTIQARMVTAPAAHFKIPGTKDKCNTWFKAAI
jgi:hypothetical protein